MGVGLCHASGHDKAVALANGVAPILTPFSSASISGVSSEFWSLALTAFHLLHTLQLGDRAAP